jgi:hypothetical protein
MNVVKFLASVLGLCTACLGLIRVIQARRKARADSIKELIVGVVNIAHQIVLLTPKMEEFLANVRAERAAKTAKAQDGQYLSTPQ